jgi:hypothetical protein
MRRVHALRNAAPLALAAWLGSTGCTSYYCYYPAGTFPVLPGQSIDVCDVPTQTSGGTVVSSTGEPPLVVANPSSPRVLISEPLGRGPLLSGGARFPWRRPDPESIASTRVEGAMDDDTATR